jgi:hypothetical protein
LDLPAMRHGLGVVCSEMFLHAAGCYGHKLHHCDNAGRSILVSSGDQGDQ